MTVEQSLIRLTESRFRLSPKYSLHNDTYKFQEGTIPCIGHEKQLSLMKKKIAHTDGGAFLVTGFRGVGKSTLVNNAVENLRADRESEVFCVRSVFTAEKTYSDILFEFSKGLYSLVSASKVWSKINKTTKERMDSINRRLQLRSLRVQSGRSSEKNNKFATPQSLPFLSSETAAKTLVSSSEEGEYRELTPYELEKELSDIITSLHQIDDKIKIVFIIDEIDKLTQNEDGQKDFDLFLNRAKSIVCSLHAIFIFIAGIDIFYMWEQDRTRIDSLYSSIFSWQLYLPCVWNSVSDMFQVFNENSAVFEPVADPYAPLVKSKTIKRLQQPFEYLRRYFVFVGKGLPRMIIQLFDEFVIWENDYPYFVLESSRILNIVRINALFRKFQKFTENESFDSDIERDKHYILFLAILDCLPKLGKDSFSEEDIVNALLLNDRIGITSFRKTVSKLLDSLVEAHILAHNRQTALRMFDITDQTIVSIKGGYIGINDPKDEENSTDNDETITNNQSNLFLLNTIGESGNKSIDDFWNGKYYLEKTYETKRGVKVCLVTQSESQKKRIATFYSKETRNGNQGYDDKLIAKCNKKSVFQNSKLINSEIILLNGFVFSIVQDIVPGLLLSELATASIKTELLGNIINQLTEFSRYMIDKGCGFLRFSPENIIVMKSGKIKILNFLNLFHQHPLEESSSRLDDTYIQNKQCVFSIGQLLLFMIAQGDKQVYIDTSSLDRYEILNKANCSKKLVNLICNMTEPNPANRPDLKDLIDSLQKCPEFRKKRMPLQEQVPDEVRIIETESDPQEDLRASNISPSTLAFFHSTLFSSDALSYNQKMQMQSQENKEESPSPKTANPAKKHTEPLPENLLVLLMNQTTQETVPVPYVPFVIGRSDADYNVNDPLVSKIHASITCHNGVLSLRNHGKNGILLRDFRLLKKPIKIKKHLSFMIGQQRMSILVCHQNNKTASSETNNRLS